MYPDIVKLIPLPEQNYGGISLIRGRSYTVQQSVGLYPTSATSDDYAFSRHIINPDSSKTYGFTIEFGKRDEGFIPKISEMYNIINEISSGLTAFCVSLSNQNK